MPPETPKEADNPEILMILFPPIQESQNKDYNLYY